MLVQRTFTRQRQCRNRLATAFSSLSVGCLTVLCLTAFGAWAQGNVVERQVKAAPGRDVRVGIYTDIRPDCSPGPLPSIRLIAPPAHGAVTVKRAMLKATNIKQCLATEAPALVAFYHAKDNYAGADTFDLEIIFGERRQIQRFHVQVANAPGAGQGI